MSAFLPASAAVAIHPDRRFLGLTALAAAAILASIAANPLRAQAPTLADPAMAPAPGSSDRLPPALAPILRGVDAVGPMPVPDMGKFTLTLRCERAGGGHWLTVFDRDNSSSRSRR